MKRKSDPEYPLPDGWVVEFADKADLEHSFQTLKGRRHFYVEALRGRIRSLQLRFADAWHHFQKAEAYSTRVAETIPNLIRQFLLHVWCLENHLMEEPLGESDLETPSLPIPPLFQQSLPEFPEIKLVIDLGRRAEAVLRLHLGQNEEAEKIYQRLIKENPTDDNLPYYYLGLACCLHNEGQEDLALRNLENAGYATLTQSRTLNRGTSAALLFGLYSQLGESEHAASWQSFLEHLPCPLATRDALLSRGQLLLKRCTEKSCLLVF